MSTFQRAVRILIGLGITAATSILVVALALARQLIRPTRRPLWAWPRDVGLAFEDVEFPARDGARLSGWFIPASATGPRPAVILVHGWRWNRLGTSAESLADSIAGVAPIDLLHLAHALQRAGYHVLMFDLRNHGRSAGVRPMTFGLQEANDVLGAVDYLLTRPAVDPARIGAVGFSIGANAILFSLAHTSAVRTAVLVQPSSPQLFAPRFAADLFGALGGPILWMAQKLYRLVGGPALKTVEPLQIAPNVSIPVLYIQGSRDRWGSVDNVAALAAATPHALPPVFVDVHLRYDGYRHIITQPRLVTDFLWQNL